ncbi:Fyve, Rhogef And Ph Domain-Containing Protein 5 [Manis pentadactyla]|nr:Fyve, Rhogef And Ph Domain-Containing Protein 5 [Manis pentadactyla]
MPESLSRPTPQASVKYHIPGPASASCPCLSQSSPPEREECYQVPSEIALQLGKENEESVGTRPRAGVNRGQKTAGTISRPTISRSHRLPAGAR